MRGLTKTRDVTLVILEIST